MAENSLDERVHVGADARGKDLDVVTALEHAHDGHAATNLRHLGGEPSVVGVRERGIRILKASELRMRQPQNMGAALFCVALLRGESAQHRSFDRCRA